MPRATPEYSRREVNAAGAALLDESLSEGAYEQALAVVNYWREAHASPLANFQRALRKSANQINKYSVVTQRLKRLPAIKLKLQQQPTMKLAQMQDIGGCRVVARDIKTIKRLKDEFDKVNRSHRHQLVNEKNYIECPRGSGYRGIHQVYRYHSDKNELSNGLKIEVQLRTWEQHAWATAVEAVDMFTGQTLKSGLGSNQWIRFFEIMGSVFALRERAPLVPGTPERRSELLDELRFQTEDLDVINKLNSYDKKLNRNFRLKKSTADSYYILEFDPRAFQLRVQDYSKKDAAKAMSAYFGLERQHRGSFNSDAVLVSLADSTNLSTAYRNYFADTTRFIQEVNRAIETNLSKSFYPGTVA